MTLPLRWGIVGLGNVVRAKFMPALRKSAQAELVACVVRSEASAAIAEAFAVPHRHATFDALLADAAVDAVYIATPNSLHREHATQALRAGKHVLCEKPLALDVADAQAIVRAAQESQRVLGVCFQFRYDALFRRVREIVQQGDLGELRAALLTATSPVGPMRTWRNAAAEGGVLSDLGVHYLDLLPWITGLPFQRVSALVTPALPTQTPHQSVTVMGALGDACHAVVRVSREMRAGSNLLSIEGLNGTLSCSAIRWTKQYLLRVTTDTGTREELIDLADEFVGQVDAFARAVRGEASDMALGQDGVAVVAIAQAIQDFLQAGAGAAVSELPAALHLKA